MLSFYKVLIKLSLFILKSKLNLLKTHLAFSGFKFGVFFPPLIELRGGKNEEERRTAPVFLPSFVLATMQMTSS